MDIQGIILEMENLLLSSNDPNVLMLRNVLDGVEGFMSGALGIIVWCIIVSIPLSTTIDVVFFLIPCTHNIVESAASKKMRLVTRNAYKAYKDNVESGEDNILKFYIKYRIVDYIAASVLLALVLSNLWDSILLWATDLVSVIICWIMGVF